MINICFLTDYCPWGKTEIFEEKDRGFLKLICASLSVYLFSFLSMRCFHRLGGAKMMLREVGRWMKPGDFIYKTDIYSYYASINHEILVRQLEKANVPEAQLTVIKSYCKRIILSPCEKSVKSLKLHLSLCGRGRCTAAGEGYI